MEKDLRLLKQVSFLEFNSSEALAGVFALVDVLCETQELKDKYAKRLEHYNQSIRKEIVELMSTCPPHFTFE